MAKYQKTNTVDGYAALKAAARAAHAQPKSPVAPPRAEAVHVGRTVVPPKHVIQCYECGYTFQLHGKASSTNCSKCRVILDISDHAITGPWSKSLKTAGHIRIAADARIDGGELVGNDIVLAGTVKKGKLRAMRRLELEAGATFPEDAVSAPDLSIAAGAVIVFDEPGQYRDVQIHGTLRARLRVNGTIRIHTGGWLDGELETAHLTIEEGGGLTGAVTLSRDNPATDER